MSASGGTTLPYQTISDLPKAQVDQYTRHAKETFLKAFNNAYEEYGHNEYRGVPEWQQSL
jgi:cation transport regulator